MPVITESEMPAHSFSYRKIIGLREIIRSGFVEVILKDIRAYGHTNQYLVKFIELAREAFG